MERMTVPARRVLGWIDSQRVSSHELACYLAEHTGRSFDAWHRWLARLPHQETVEIGIVEDMLLAVGRHISEVDPYYGLVSA